MNYLMPHVQRIPNKLLRSEWATKISQQLRVEEPVLREALRKAASERRGEVKTKPELVAATIKPAERRLIQMLVEAEGFRGKLAQELREAGLHHGLETERIFTALLDACSNDARPDPAALGQALDERDRRLFFDMVFEAGAEATWEEAESCLAALRRRQAEAELSAVQKEIESCLPEKQTQTPAAPSEELRRLLARKQELRRRLEGLAR